MACTSGGEVKVFQEKEILSGFKGEGNQRAGEVDIKKGGTCEKLCCKCLIVLKYP